MDKPEKNNRADQWWYGLTPQQRVVIHKIHRLAETTPKPEVTIMNQGWTPTEDIQPKSSSS